MKTIGIIPARYASTRLPAKPLARIGNKVMIQWVYEQCLKSHSLAEVWVATDDERIFKAVEDFGGRVVMTASTHESGTARCAEAVEKMATNAQIVVNIQGDEPFINPVQIDQLVACFQKDTTQIATLIKVIKEEDTLWDTNKPKVVVNQQQQALYFSRQTIPYLRGIDKNDWLAHHTFYKHVGIYGFRKSILQDLIPLTPSPLETVEKLEQLRWLAHGYTIQTATTTLESLSVDTQEDLELARRMVIT
ncbi:MAG: 3-deoxy-manno-octulosonate cytidylyltransferase [Chitinophagales bacterium]